VYKVLVIITTGMTSYGGLTTVAMNYYRNIDLTKIQMDFLSTNTIQKELADELTKKESRYYCLSNRNSNPIGYYFKLRKICKKYDCIHVHANSATATAELLAAKSAGVKKRIVHIHNTTCSHKIIHYLLKPVFDKSYTLGIGCSDAAGRWAFGKKKYIVLNNAIDLDKYDYNLEDRTYIRKKYGIRDDEYVIGNVGKLSKQKNHEFVIKVFHYYYQTHENCKLLLVGDGALRPKLEELAKCFNVSDKVIFCGMVDNAKEFYSAMDCILFPSLWEGLPLSLLEAQATGLTCVSSNNITSEVNMGGVIQLSLNDDLNYWEDKLKQALSSNRNEDKKKYRENLRKNGFDIRANAHVLQELYLG